MAVFVQTVKKWYLREIWALDHVKHVFLLILRLYFGWGFISAGLGKLLNVEATVGFFRDWGIPLPTFNVYMAGTTETVCGFLLMIGAASRLITIPLIGTMLVAYVTAHTEQFYALFDSETRATFFEAGPPFPYLFTCLVVLFFGPGRISIDSWVKSVLERQHPNRGNTSADTANGHMTSPSSPASINPDMTTLTS